MRWHATLRSTGRRIDWLSGEAYVSRVFLSLRNYQRDWVRADVVAGLTVWAVLIPSSLAYATIAGVPPEGGNRHEPANTPGIRHVTFAVDDIDATVARLRAGGAELVGELENYEDSYRLCYVRGPEGIIVELAEQIG
jgi:catechol 2,3-dioxygenase-like lactoylglutathione lyase family enzyme